MSVKQILEQMATVMAHYAGSTAVNMAMSRAVGQIMEGIAALPDDRDAPAENPMEARMRAVEKAVADLHAALSDSPSPPAVQRAVSEVEMPHTGGRRWARAGTEC